MRYLCTTCFLVSQSIENARGCLKRVRDPLTTTSIHCPSIFYWTGTVVSVYLLGVVIYRGKLLSVSCPYIMAAYVSRPSCQLLHQAVHMAMEASSVYKAEASIKGMSTIMNCCCNSCSLIAYQGKVSTLNKVLHKTSCVTES